MYSILMTVGLVVAFILMVVVLMQSSKGGGLAGTFGRVGEMGTMFGVRRTADFLSKATWWLAGILAVLCLVVNLAFLPSSSQQRMRESIIQRGGQQSLPQKPFVPQTQQPAQPPQQTPPQQ
ncbi:MAG: preprotein translocase subunit SecG [Ignavibacteria bacterium]|nr:preprotein translocase subunit SecG [Ignavibacteria bacterium]